MLHPRDQKVFQNVHYLNLSAAYTRANTVFRSPGFRDDRRKEDGVEPTELRFFSVLCRTETGSSVFQSHQNYQDTLISERAGGLNILEPFGEYLHLVGSGGAAYEQERETTPPLCFKSSLRCQPLKSPHVPI